MTIGEYLRKKDIDTYRKLMKIGKRHKKKKKEIMLGDRPERLMANDSYRRIRGTLRQKTWS